MSCEEEQTQFNPFEPYGFSIENEVMSSPHCISNLLKIIVWSWWLVFFVCMIFLAVSLMIRESLMGIHWSPVMRSSLMHFTASLSEVIIMGILLSGTHTPAIYFFYGMAQIPYSVTIIGIRERFIAVSMISSLNSADINMVKKKYNASSLTLVVLTILGFLICWVIGPMVWFNDPWILNRVYAAGYAHHGIAFFFQLLTLAHFSKKLLNVLEPAREFSKDEKLSDLVLQLQYQTKFVRYVLFTQLVPLLVPLWLGLTQTETNPGMANFFYYEFFYTTLVRGLSILFSLIGHARAVNMEVRHSSSSGHNHNHSNSNHNQSNHDHGNSNSNSHSHSHDSSSNANNNVGRDSGSITRKTKVQNLNKLESPPSFPSYTIEELKGEQVIDVEMN